MAEEASVKTCSGCGLLLIETEVRFDAGGKVFCKECFAKGIESLARRLKRDHRGKEEARHEAERC